MKFRRKSTEPVAEELEGTVEAPAEAPVADGQEADPTGPAERPADADELADDDEVERLDLGSLLIEPEADRELRLQVDEATGEVQAVMLAGPDGAVELRAFAAPRNGDLWSTVRPQIAAEMAQRGGTATEREGRFGTELVCQLPVQMRGRQRRHPALAHHRASTARAGCCARTLLGRPALEPDGAEAWEDAIARSSYAGATARCRSASRCRSCCRPTPVASTPRPPEPRRLDACPRRAACDARSASGPAPRTSTPATCAAPTPRPACSGSPTRRTVSGCACAAPCARSRCAPAAASRRWRPSCSTAPA